jgi:hypothetical protein
VGKEKVEQRRNLAALVLFAYIEGLGQEWVSSLFLAEAARQSKLYDKTRFGKNLRHEWFRQKGAKKGMMYKLSSPGLSHAKDLLKSIAN